MLRRFFEPNALLDRNDRAHSVLIAALILGSAVLEIATVGLIFPLIQIIVNPQMLFRSRWLAAAFSFSHLHEPRYFPAVFATFLVAFVGLKSIYNSLLTMYQGWFYQHVSAKVGERLVTNYLYSNWSYFLNRNSAEMINVADFMSGWPLTNTLSSYHLIITEGLVTFGILCVLLAISPISTLLLVSIFGTLLIISHNAVRRRLIALSERNASFGTERVQILQESIASAKEIKVLGRESIFIERYAAIRDQNASVLADIVLWQSIPRFVIEPLIMIATTAIIISVLLVPNNNEVGMTTAILGLFAAAGTRITPSLTRVLGASNFIRLYSDSLRRIEADLKKEPERTAATAGPLVPILQREIRFAIVDFQYPLSTNQILKAFSLVVKKGESVALIGATGAGKTTVADLVLGLLQPVSGSIQIDGVDISGDWRGWQKQIGYVPQHISLIDASLSENIALGLKPGAIDAGRIRKIISLVHLDNLLERMPDDLDSKIGERGVKLSGGERQRIGIARALYDGRTVLVMDEATSALDNDTENAIAHSIEQLHGEYTLLVIAHRVRTIRRCDKVVLLACGKIIDQGTFTELADRCKEFRKLLQIGTDLIV